METKNGTELEVLQEPVLTMKPQTPGLV